MLIKHFVIKLSKIDTAVSGTGHSLDVTCLKVLCVIFSVCQFPAPRPIVLLHWSHDDMMDPDWKIS